jgi:hypothetical protein
MDRAHQSDHARLVSVDVDAGASLDHAVELFERVEAIVR